MKKLVAFILLLLMLFMSVSCNNMPNTDTGSDTISDSGSQEKPEYKPNVTEDRTKYVATYNAAKTKINYGKESLIAPVLSKYYNNYEAAISMTFDDGDDVNTGHILNELFAKYGFKGTLMLGADSVKNDIEEWNEILSKGYLDVGCHGYYHVGPTSINDKETLTRETKEAVEFLRKNFPTQKVLTFATPLANITDEYEAALRELVISNRLEQSGNLVEYGKNYNMYRISSVSFNVSKTLSFINSQADISVKSGDWLVELMHGVIDGNRHSTDIDKATFEKHCEYLYDKYNGKVWFGSFEEVSLYVYQYENSTFEYVACDKNSMTFKLTTDPSLDKSIFNIPMSATVDIPSYATSAYYLINGVEYDVEIEKLGQRRRVVRLNDIPTDGSEIQLFFSGNKTVANGCYAHKYDETIVKSTCTTHGYRELECTYCHNTYKTDYYDMHNFNIPVEIEGKFYDMCDDCDAVRIRGSS